MEGESPKNGVSYQRIVCGWKDEREEPDERQFVNV